jgi:ABC-type multidrug transport system fused ATPase/permease subunit
MDYIFVFDQGKIVEEGKPTDLLKVKGHYAKLWGTQTSGYI